MATRSFTVTTGTMVTTDVERAAARAHYPVVSVAVPAALCPDLLRYAQIGEADGWRGRVVRGLFFVLRLWPPTEQLPLLFLDRRASNKCSLLAYMRDRKWRRRDAISDGGDRDS